MAANNWGSVLLLLKQYSQSTKPLKRLLALSGMRVLTVLLALFIEISIFFSWPASAMAQVANQFPCTSDFYFSQGSGANVGLNTINTSTGTFIPAPFPGFNGGGINFNALSYNVQDGNLYALSLSPRGTTNPVTYDFYRVTPTGPQAIGSITTTIKIPNDGNENQAFAGDFDSVGNMTVVTNGGDIFTFTVAQAIANATVGANDLGNVFIPDIAYNPSDQRFYGLDRDANNQLKSFLPAGAATVINVGAALGNTLPYGGAFFDANGDFYAYRNFSAPGPVGPGQFDRIALPAATLTTLSNPGVSARNDGASCAFVPGFNKTVTPSPAAAGSIVTYTYTFTNRTTIPLNNLTFRDTMDNGRTFVAGSQTLTGFTGAPNVSLGAGNSALTITGISLPAAPAPPTTITTATITIQVQIPVALNGRVFNQATIEGEIGGTGTQLQSASDNPTTAAFPDRTPLDVGAAQGIIGVAKQAGTPVPVAAGVFDVPFTVRVENAGPLSITDTQLTEDLNTTFAAATTAVLQVAPAVSATGNTGGGGFVGPPTPPAGVNAGFNGGLVGPADNNLLAAATTLDPGDFIEVTFTVRVTPGATLSYNNTVTATGTSGGNPIQDVSQDGVAVDPDGDGNPTNNNVPTPINFGPNLRLLKRIHNVAGVTTFPAGFFGNVVDASDSGVVALQAANLPPTGVTTINPANGDPSIQSGDTVTYRVYFINTGGATASNVQLCDQIPTGTNYSNGSIRRALQASIGDLTPVITNLADATNFVTAGTAVTVPPCLAPASNPNGSVLPTPAFNVDAGIGGYLEFETLVP